MSLRNQVNEQVVRVGQDEVHDLQIFELNGHLQGCHVHQLRVRVLTLDLYFRGFAERVGVVLEVDQQEREDLKSSVLDRHVQKSHSCEVVDLHLVAGNLALKLYLLLEVFFEQVHELKQLVVLDKPF